MALEPHNNGRTPARKDAAIRQGEHNTWGRTPSARREAVSCCSVSLAASFVLVRKVMAWSRQTLIIHRRWRWRDSVWHLQTHACVYHACLLQAHHVSSAERSSAAQRSAEDACNGLSRLDLAAYFACMRDNGSERVRKRKQVPIDQPVGECSVAVEARQSCWRLAESVYCQPPRECRCDAQTWRVTRGMAVDQQHGVAWGQACRVCTTRRHTPRALSTPM